MNKVNKLFLALFIFLNFFSNIRAQIYWTGSGNAKEVSCLLYRHRLYNYFQRNSELFLASKMLKNQLTYQDVLNLNELWKRIGLPLLTEEMAIFSETKIINGQWIAFLSEKNSKIKVKIESQSLNWEADKFIFPDEIAKVSIDNINQTLNFQYILPYSEACLQKFDLKLTFTNFQTNEKLELNFKLDKFSWDYENILKN